MNFLKDFKQFESNKKEYAYLALREKPTWDENEQIEMFDTWANIVKKAKEMSKENNKEVRISSSKGFNNNGKYFLER